MEALASFPKRVDYIKTQKGEAHLIKMDIFKGIMYYAYTDPKMRGPMVPVPKDRVTEIKEMNKNKEYPEELVVEKYDIAVEEEISFADVTGVIELPAEKRHKKRRNRGGSKSKGGQNRYKGNKKKGDNKSKPKNPSDKSQAQSGPSNKQKSGPEKKGNGGNQNANPKKKKRYFKKPKKKD